MVLIAPFVGAAVLLSGLVSGAPRPQDSSASSYGSSYGSSSDSSSNYGSSGSSYGSSGSSYGSSGSGYDSSNTGYGSSSDSSYGSSNSGYGSSNSYGSGSSDSSIMSDMSDSTSSVMSDSTSTAMMSDTTSSVMMSDTTTTAYDSSTTSISYGSGSSNWGGSGYDDCVQQCIASFGAPPATYQATATSGSSGSSGTGATHTVIVAPTKGVFRYVPFAVNASVGDTIEFHWGADEHTVTKSSALTPCNKSSEPLFASGEQNQSFVFSQVVNDTSPTFFYCGTPTHCQKGMFGIINPLSSFDAPTSFSGSIQSMAANSSDISAYVSYSDSVTSNSTSDLAKSWGGSIDLSALPTWAHSLAAENILFTRNTIAMNQDIVGADGSSINLASVSSTPLMLPNDIAPALNAATAPSSTASDSTASSSAAPVEATNAAAAATSTVPSNGASSLASPRALVALMVVIATFFAL